MVNMVIKIFKLVPHYEVKIVFSKKGADASGHPHAKKVNLGTNLYALHKN